MDTTIDTLSIEIESNSSNSTKGLDNLISRLESLNNTISQNLGNLEKLSTALSNISKIKTNNIKMPKMGAQKISTPISKMSGLNVGSTGTKLVHTTPTEKPKKQDKISSNGAKKAGKDAKDAGDKANTAQTKFQKLASAVKSITSGNVGKVGTAVQKIGSTAGKVGLSVAKGFGKVATAGIKKLGLALVGVRSAFTAVRSAMQEYMNYDTSLRDSLSMTWASLGSLLAPILEYIIKLFGTVVGYIRAFVKALTGIDLVARANSKAISGVGESAKKTLGSLAKFDDLNTVDFNTDSGGGGGSSLPPLTTPEVDTSGIEHFVDLMKNGDWYDLGFELGEKINEGLEKINFDVLIEKAGKLGTNLAETLNGLTDGINWTLIGETLAGGLNTVLSFGNSFLDTYDFVNFGDSLGEGFNGFIKDIDWFGIGDLLGSSLQGAIDTAFGFVRTTDYSELGTGIGDTINGFFENIDLETTGITIGTLATGLIDTLASTIETTDWSQVGSEISGFVTGLLDEINYWLETTDWTEMRTTITNAFGDLLSGIDWSSIVAGIFKALGNAAKNSSDQATEVVIEIGNAIKDAFTQYIDEDANFFENGWNIIKGVFEGISSHLRNVDTWVWDNIFKPFIDGFTDAFDINSPSKEMETMGGYIIDGLFEGLKGIWDSVKTIFEDLKEQIKVKFLEMKDNVKKTFSKENMTNIFNTVKTTITTKFTEIKENIKIKMKEAWTGVKNAFSNVKSFFNGIFETIKGIFKKVGTTVGSAIGDSFKTVVNKVIGFAENTINKFIKAINDSISLINEIPGVNIKKLKEISIPKLATGTNEIKSEGLYHLHKGEAVVPEKYNPAVNEQSVKTDNSDVVSAIYRLQRSIDNLDITNVVNLGNKTLYKETVKYAKNQNDIYGENVMSV